MYTTFDALSRKKYGSPAYAELLRSANPGVASPFPDSTDLVIPDIQSVGDSREPAWGASDETILHINGRKFIFWQTINISMSVDSLRTVTFSAPFEPVYAEFKNEFKPFTYTRCSVSVAGVTVFMGSIVGVEPAEGMVTVTCYSTPGALADCTLPLSAFPAEYTGLKLSEIARSVARPFGVQVISRSGGGAPFDLVSCKVGTAVLDFIVDLAQQRGLVVTDDARGSLVLQRAVSKGATVARLSQGVLPLVSVTPALNAREYYSHIGGVTAAEVGAEGATYTARNAHLKGVFRPYTYLAQDVEAGGLREAVRAKVGRMIGSAIQYKAIIASWRGPSGAIWQPGSFLLLTYPDSLVYTEYKFLIRSVTLEKTADAATTELDLCLPGAFTGEIPERLPWD